MRRRRAAGEYGFYQLVDQAADVREINSFAQGLGQAFDHVLVLGIGGSALGTKAVLSALRAPAWNEWDDEGREFFPLLTVLDNVDPTTVKAALARIDPRREPVRYEDLVVRSPQLVRVHVRSEDGSVVGDRERSRVQRRDQPDRQRRELRLGPARDVQRHGSWRHE